ncbi:hypothetical protein FEK35_30225 [Nocardia cyriacigeorgica]|uniref:Uncharacterized protein n=1 Tax=Nocardia cyriacigeorgica TaxID=135487 RepID=A0A5R8P6Y0_9NOCA|nr:hypothetical protein [Nocardia cyriacigeorgica]TLF92925.1 hypothetical protein FEK35_30225 [Nocardia cyriacigeorgica]
MASKIIDEMTCGTETGVPAEADQRHVYVLHEMVIHYQSCDTRKVVISAEPGCVRAVAVTRSSATPSMGVLVGGPIAAICTRIRWSSRERSLDHLTD